MMLLATMSNHRGSPPTCTGPGQWPCEPTAFFPLKVGSQGVGGRGAPTGLAPGSKRSATGMRARCCCRSNLHRRAFTSPDQSLSAKIHSSGPIFSKRRVPVYKEEQPRGTTFCPTPTALPDELGAMGEALGGELVVVTNPRNARVVQGQANLNPVQERSCFEKSVETGRRRTRSHRFLDANPPRPGDGTR